MGTKLGMYVLDQWVVYRVLGMQAGYCMAAGLMLAVGLRPGIMYM